MKNAKLIHLITIIVIVITWTIWNEFSYGLGSGPVIFPKIDRQPPPVDYHRDGITALLTDPLQMDLRSYDLSALDLSGSMSSLLYATFDDRTTWPPDDRIPEGFDWQRIMDLGKNPGLGIRSLHAQGITGRGVGIAIIDQTLLVDHQEYAGQLRLYEETDDAVSEWSESQLHGATVASITVGKTVGVAPEADLYYIATARGFTNNSFTYLARSIQRILEINGQLPPENKIRVISMSLHWVEGVEGYDELMAAVGEAKGAGMLIVCANIEQVHGFKFYGLGRSPLADPDAFESYEPGLSWANDFYVGERPSDRLLVPMDSRTTASPTGQSDYVFLREGGLSWSIPYIAGLYALAAQVDPELTPELFWSLAMETGRTIELEHDGETIPLGPIVDPVALIGKIKAELLSPSATLTVQVVGTQDQGLNAAQVNIQNSVGTMIFSGVANEQGVASVEVPYGTYSVSVNYKGFTNTVSLSVDSPLTVQTIAVNVYVELFGYAMAFTTFVLWAVIIIVAVLIIVFLLFRKFIKPKTSANT